MKTEQWLVLSEALTGFQKIDLLGTGLVEPYLELVKSDAPEWLRELAKLADELETSHSPAALVRQAIDDPSNGILKEIIFLWYLGQWRRATDDVSEDGTVKKRKTIVVSREAYKHGLAWTAIGVKPMGVKQTGFGSWSEPPAKYRDITL